MAANDPPHSEVAAAAPAPAAADDDDWVGMSAAAPSPAPAPAPAADDGDDEFSASFGMSTAAPANDPPSPTVTAVEHTEGTSYEVAFGDPSRFPLTNSDNYYHSDFPAAGGENPYQPEIGLMAPLVDELKQLGSAPDWAHSAFIGNASCVAVYGALRCVPEQSRGLSPAKLIVKITQSNLDVRAAYRWILDDAQLGDGARSFLYVSLIICLYRMCYRDGTLQAFATTPEDATTGDRNEYSLGALYFNLSPRERTRLREYANGVRRDRRMPYVLSRQLILRKAQRGGGPSGRFIRRNFLPDSDELFRVVVSFL